jgi:hypothetical protein
VLLLLKGAKGARFERVLGKEGDFYRGEGGDFFIGKEVIDILYQLERVKFEL